MKLVLRNETNATDYTLGLISDSGNGFLDEDFEARGNLTISSLGTSERVAGSLKIDYDSGENINNQVSTGVNIESGDTVKIQLKMAIADSSDDFEVYQSYVRKLK